MTSAGRLHGAKTTTNASRLLDSSLETPNTDQQLPPTTCVTWHTSQLNGTPATTAQVTRKCAVPDDEDVVPPQKKNSKTQKVSNSLHSLAYL